MKLDAGAAPSRLRKQPDGTLDKIQKHRTAGVTFAAIGEHQGVSRGTVGKVLRKAGKTGRVDRAPKKE